MNNNKRDQPALLAHCKGVFSATSWLNHGETDSPLPYPVKVTERDSYRGKQFGTAATKTGKQPSEYFDPKHKYLAEEAQFVDRWPYAEQQPEKQLGFGTADFSKRDEFTLTTRVEQQREQLRHERRMQKAAQDKLQAKGGGAVSTLPAQAKKAVPLLFDLVFNKDSQFCEKVKHDTLNPTALTRDRNYGPYKTMAMMAHGPPEVSPCKQQHAHRPAIEEEFYRRTNVFFPKGCAAAEPR